MFKTIGIILIILGLFAGFTLIGFPFIANDWKRILGLWGLFVIGVAMGIVLTGLPSQNSIKLIANTLILISFLSGIAIFIDIMGWINTYPEGIKLYENTVIESSESNHTGFYNGFISLWIEFVICGVVSIYGKNRLD